MANPDVPYERSLQPSLPVGLQANLGPGQYCNSNLRKGLQEDTQS